MMGNTSCRIKITKVINSILYKKDDIYNFINKQL